MCFSSPSIPSVSAPPPIAPSPIPTTTSPTATVEGRQRQVAMLKYGALSTITNQGGASGITGGGSDLSTSYPSMATGKQTIGG